jgi:hypothetical protein
MCFAEPTTAEELKANTVVLTNGSGHGSGVLFTRDDKTFIWTAAHVADIWENHDGTYELATIIQGDKRGKARVVRNGDHEAGVDVALLEVVEGDFTGTAEFYRGFNEIEIGQKVIHCGTPYDRNWNERLIAYGRVANVDHLVDGRPLLKPRRIDQVDITGYPGCSGGPVVDEATGGIIGLLVMGSAPRLTIIEPTRHIYQWAKEHDCLWAFDPTLDMPETRAAWPSDRHIRQVKDRYCPQDDEWGTIPPMEQLPTLEEVIEAIIIEIEAIRDELREDAIREEEEQPTPVDSVPVDADDLDSVLVPSGDAPLEVEPLEPLDPSEPLQGPMLTPRP